MPRRAAAVALAALVALFLAGIVRVLKLRLVAGDVYPPYSSLRADPLGTRVLHDALETMPGVSVSRRHAPLARLGDGTGSTLLVLGARHGEEMLLEPDAKALARFVIGGGRLVVAFLPAKGEGSFVREPRATSRPSRGLLEGWGADVVFSRSTEKKERPKARATEAGLPPELSWHTDASFETSGAWSVLYTCAGYPVVVERMVGAGSVVLSADAYRFSNEALVKERAPRLLSRLLGSPRAIVFDETHLGVAQEEGVAALARRYRLAPFGASLLALAALFVWMSGATLLPRRETDGAAAAVAGRDAFAGLVSLLKRGIPESDLLGACVEEWKRSAPKRTGTERRARLDELAAGEGRADPAAAYRLGFRMLAAKEKNES